MTWMELCVKSIGDELIQLQQGGFIEDYRQISEAVKKAPEMKSQSTVSGFAPECQKPNRDGPLVVDLQSNTLTSVPLLRGKDGVVAAEMGGGARVRVDFEDKGVHQPSSSSSHTHVRKCTESSELIVVLGEVLSVVCGLASHKHVPVFKDLLFGQHLVLRREDKGITR
ncbi:hypothetical protein EYF80_034643 [Liparis tanakae]|uniref:Uncharacterized protein n=1 Tax=Liparis tanakae TaxID=230148 RepID=A0A4Z2GP36_9TELE|nr:hypothetical protein EYF80_034643 [Liparis tanakae]